MSLPRMNPGADALLPACTMAPAAFAPRARDGATERTQPMPRGLISASGAIGHGDAVVVITTKRLTGRPWHA